MSQENHVSLEEYAELQIHKKMNEVAAAINAKGIAKDKQSQADGKYYFRGIDAVMDNFAGILSKAGIYYVPSYSNRQLDVRATKSGGVIYNVTVEGTFMFVAPDGSSITAGPFFGEANDMSDKATSKAMSISLRNCLLQTFCAPLGPDMDTENFDSEGNYIHPDENAPRGKTQPTKISDEDANDSHLDQEEGSGQRPGYTEQQRKLVEAKAKAAGLKFQDVSTGVRGLYGDNVGEALTWIKKNGRR